MSDPHEGTDGFTVGRSKMGEAVILAPSAAVTQETCEALGAAIDHAAEGSRPVVVIDCHHVSALDSSALESLIAWQDRLVERGGVLRLANLNDVCSDILMVTRLIYVLNISPSVKQAVEGR